MRFDQNFLARCKRVPASFACFLPGTTPYAAGRQRRRLGQRCRGKLLKFEQKVESRYSEGTLERLLAWHQAEVRQAATLALGLVGSIKVNGVIACRLRDEDVLVRQFAADAMWSLWCRADSAENNQELQRLMRLDPHDENLNEILTAYATLICRAPHFAEAYNQRAILHFRMGNLPKSIPDCEKTLRLNPYHFGAACGLAQCFMKQKKLRAALRCYRRALRINPNLENVRESIASLEKILGEEGKR